MNERGADRIKKPGIYVHLPFCAVHCSYCDFPLTTHLSLAPGYYDALQKEIQMHPLQELADTLYFGGGTPSLTPPQILLQIKRSFRLDPDAEVTLEANPDDIRNDSLKAWKQLGITRLSIGIQSLEESVLRAMLRKHSTAEAREALSSARDAGFEDISVDLILGFPQQTVRGFLEGLQSLVDFRPQHFSLYFLEIHDNTALHRTIESGRCELMREEDQLQCYTAAVKLLNEAGYLHYEVSNFALPERSSRHNLKYWTNAPYEAYGVGACSYIDSIRTTNLASVTGYIEAVAAGRLPVSNRIKENKDTEMRNALIFGLRKTEGVDCREFEKDFGVSPLSLFEKSAGEFLEAGLLEVAKGHLRLTLRGMLVSNEILSNLV